MDDGGDPGSAPLTFREGEDGGGGHRQRLDAFTQIDRPVQSDQTLFRRLVDLRDPGDRDGARKLRQVTQDRAELFGGQAWVGHGAAVEGPIREVGGERVRNGLWLRVWLRSAANQCEQQGERERGREPSQEGHVSHRKQQG